MNLYHVVMDFEVYSDCSNEDFDRASISIVHEDIPGFIRRWEYKSEIMEDDCK